MSDIAIKAEDIGKLYKLGEIGTGTISHDLNRWWARLRGKQDPFAKIGESNDRTQKGDSDWVWALKDINFEVKKGEVLGIIGRNGAGKSTLLKILSKVTTPTTGRIKINGRIASLLEVGTGFHQELTGRENIFLNGAILGMTKREIRSKFDEIVDFAGVERYIDTPVKRYSSGMYVRLAFAVAAFLEPEILIIDEVLAVGDAEFQKKCLGRMKDVSLNDGRTVLFVSHDLNAISQLCNSTLLIAKGMAIEKGNTNDVINLYNSDKSALSIYAKSGVVTKESYIKSIRVCNSQGDTASSFCYDEKIYIEIKLKLSDTIGVKPDFFLMLLDAKKRRVFACEAEKTKEGLLLTIESKQLVRGDYSIHCFINIPNAQVIDEAYDVCYFGVIDNGSAMLKHGSYDYGVVFGNYTWTEI
jgi:lipopolysaccharide transport system ATP-binding protein